MARRRQYRVGLNVFNQNPERGMEYLLQRNFLGKLFDGFLQSYHLTSKSFTNDLEEIFIAF